MAVPGTPVIHAFHWNGDDYIHLSSTSNNATRFYVSRWNQFDGTYGGETRYDVGETFYGNVGSPGLNRKARYRIRGWNSDGFGPFNYTDYVQTTPYAPSGAAAWLSGPTAISMSWTDNAYAPYYDYDTEIWINVNGGGFNHWTTVPAGTTSAYAGGLGPGATYQFAIRHVERYDATVLASGFNYTGTITAITYPNTPGAVTATRASDSTANLSWANNSNGGAPYDSITLQRWDNVSNAWSTVANLGGGATSVSDSGIVANRKYQWRIQANNAVGSSDWSYSGNVFTTPNAPTNVNALYSGGTSISVSWANGSSYSEYGVRVQAYKNGVADGAVVSLSSGTTSYTKTSVDVVATYYFKVWNVSDVGALASTQTQSNSVMAATPPNAPTGLTSSAAVVDLARPYTISWQHSPSIDGSAQTKWSIRHRVVGAGVWQENTPYSSATSPDMTISPNFAQWGYTNGQTIEWQVQTWGVHANPSPWSASATLQTSTTPTVSITSPGNTITTSVINVAWSYFDQESTAQAEWKVELFASATNTLIETRSGTGTTSSLTMDYDAEDGVTYRIEVSVRDGSGLWSDKAVKTIVADFLPPAEVLLSADIDPASGAAILSFTRTPDDGGVTTFPASAVTIERQFWDSETETYGPWEVLASQASPDTVLIDTTAPAHDDGHYRIITHSAAPTTVRPALTITPPTLDHRWLYVSGGRNFDVVCKMWANIEISQKASRAKALHYFAGRRHPVIYSGEAAERTFTVSGLLEEEASPPQQWMRLAREAGPVLLRAPGRRMYGSLSEVSVDRIQNNLHKVSFSIQEVSL